MKACGGAVFPVVVNMVAGPRANRYVDVEGASKARGHATQRVAATCRWRPRPGAQCATSKWNSIQAQLPLAKPSLLDAGAGNDDSQARVPGPDFRDRSCACVPSTLVRSGLASPPFPSSQVSRRRPFFISTLVVSSQHASVDLPSLARLEFWSTCAEHPPRARCRLQPADGHYCRFEDKGVLPCSRELTEA